MRTMYLTLKMRKIGTEQIKLDKAEKATDFIQ